MSKIKFLTILSVALAIINIVLIGFFLFGPHHKKNDNGPKDYIVRELGLDTKQVVEYKVLVETHQKARKALNEKIMALRNELYPVALKEKNASKKEQLLTQLKSAHQDLELVHLEHFEQLQQLCKGEQLKKFDTLVDELTGLFASKRRKKKD